MMTGGTLRHAAIAFNIGATLRERLKGSPCRVYMMDARVALREGSLVVNSSQGGGTKDTWVVDDSPAQSQRQGG